MLCFQEAKCGFGDRLLDALDDSIDVRTVTARQKQNVYVLGHNHVGPQFKVVPRPRRTQRFDQPTARPVGVEQG